MGERVMTMKLIVDGYEFNKIQSYLLIGEVLSNTVVDNPNDVQEYLKNHRVEESIDNIVLRNKDINGLHFAVRKDI